MGKQFGYSRTTISNILPIYGRLKECADISAHFSNYELSMLSRIREDAFRYAFIQS